MDRESRLVLLIEDDARLAKLLSQSLEDAQIGCRCARGEQAVQAAAAWRPDLIILDAGSYHLEGLSALPALRHDRRTSRIPVVVLSGNTERRAIETVRARGASACWALHGTPPELFGARVRTAFGLPQIAQTGARHLAVAASSRVG